MLMTIISLIVLLVGLATVVVFLTNNTLLDWFITNAYTTKCVAAELAFVLGGTGMITGGTAFTVMSLLL